jgi:hypothetical protein
MENNRVFAQRILHWSSKQLAVQVSAPIPRHRGTEWHCWLDIKLIPGKRVHHERVIGIDSWQSVEIAMYAAQKIVDERYPGAYAYEPGNGTQFPFIVQESLPHEYFKQLREHLKTECARKTEELHQEFMRGRKPRNA